MATPLVDGDDFQVSGQAVSTTGKKATFRRKSSYSSRAYLANRAAMEAGGELLSDNFKFKTLADGWQTVHSAWQEVFNFIADKSYEAFCTEYQNDPPEAEKIDTLELTYQHVAGCLGGFSQGQNPDGFRCITQK